MGFEDVVYNMRNFWVPDGGGYHKSGSLDHCLDGQDHRRYCHVASRHPKTSTTTQSQFLVSMNNNYNGDKINK